MHTATSAGSSLPWPWWASRASRRCATGHRGGGFAGVWAGAASVLGRLGEAGGYSVSLPFYWAQLLLPDVAITHPLRLSIGVRLRPSSWPRVDSHR